MVADDLKKSSRARLPKQFYREEQAQDTGVSKQNYTTKYEELLKLNRSLITYKDISLPDTIYGGRNSLPQSCIGANELLQEKV